MFVHLLLKQHKAKTLSAPRLGSIFFFLGVRCSFCNSKLGPLLLRLLLIISWRKRRCRAYFCVFLMWTRRKRDRTATKNLLFFCLSFSFSYTRTSFSPGINLGDDLFSSPCDALALAPCRRVCDKVALKKNKNEKNASLVRPQATPIMRAVSRYCRF